MLRKAHKTWRFVDRFGVCGESWDYCPTTLGLEGVSLGFVVSCGRLSALLAGGFGFVADIFRKNDRIFHEMWVCFCA
jgi:hypothetical protein